eukprot:jgi/Ulvmu1/6828/UM031_0032.1
MDSSAAKEIERIPMSKTAQTLAVSPYCPKELQHKESGWCLNDFVLVKKLGVGGASAVYQAIYRRTNACVALKLYFKAKMTPLNAHQVQREVIIHTQLNHSNIISLFGAFEDADHVALIIEYAAKGDLFDLLRHMGGRMKEADVVARIMTPFMKGLAYMHSLGVIHRDIKLENTLFSADGTLKIADFGLSVDANHEAPVTRLGTLDYMSPEVLVCPDKRIPGENKQSSHLKYTDKVDAWACGVLAFELLVGCPPFGMSTREASVRAVLYESPKLPQWLPPAAADFIKWALTKNPAHRPTVAQLLQHSWILAFKRQLHRSTRAHAPSQASAHASNSTLPSSGPQLQPASADGTSRALTSASLGSCNSTHTGVHADPLCHLPGGSSFRPSLASAAHPSSHAHGPLAYQAPYASHALPDSTSAPPTSQGSAMSDLPSVHEQRTSPAQPRHMPLHLSRAATAVATAHLLSSSAFSLDVVSQRSADNWQMPAGDGSLHAASAAASVFPPSQGSNPTAPLSPPESASCPTSRRPSGCGLAAFAGLQQKQADGASKRLQGYRGVDYGCALSAPSSAASGQGQHIGDLSAAALRAGLAQRCGANAATAAWVSAATQEQLVDLAGDYLRSCGTGAGAAGGCTATQSGEAAHIVAVLQTLQQSSTSEEAAAAAATAALAAAGGAATGVSAGAPAASAAPDSMRHTAAHAAHMRTASKSSCRSAGRCGSGLSGIQDDPRRYLWDSTDKQPTLDFMMDSPSTEVSLKASEGPSSTQHAATAHGMPPEGCALLPTMSGGTMWDIHPDSLTSGFTPRAAAARSAGAAQLRAARADAAYVATESVPVDICMTGEGSMMGGVEEVVAALQQAGPGRPTSSLAGPMQLDTVAAMCGIEEVPNASAIFEGALDALHTGGASAHGAHVILPSIE